MQQQKKRFRIRLGLVATGVVLLIFLGEVGLLDGIKMAYDKHAESQRMESPVYAHDVALNAKQDEMNRQAARLSVSEQFDLMIKARAEGVDLTKTASTINGKQMDAPLAAYAFQIWASRDRVGKDRMFALLDKIARDGMPGERQLARYKALASDCSFQEAQGELYNKGLMACKAFEKAVRG